MLRRLFRSKFSKQVSNEYVAESIEYVCPDDLWILDAETQEWVGPYNDAHIEA